LSDHIWSLQELAGLSKQTAQLRSDGVNSKPGDSVVLTGIPPGLLGGLPSEDQTAITEVVRKQVLLVGYEDGRAELEFTDKRGTIHSIFLNPIFMVRAANQDIQ
jgi:hypothetical protein